MRLAAEADLAAIALCDHDNIDGIGLAQNEGRRLGVEVLSGVELSVQHGEHKDIHLLGYRFNPEYPPLVQALETFKRFRESRNEQIVERINEQLTREGRPTISFAQVRQRAGGTVGRPHISRELMHQGLVQTQDEAFQRYLIPCNVDKCFFEIAEAMDLIHAAGGIAVLAHPPFITRDRRLLMQLIDCFREMGLDGVEAYNNGATQEDVYWMISQARRRGLAVTGGSDYHGIDDGLIEIGTGRGSLSVPYDCVEDINRAWQHRFGTSEGLSE